MKRTVIVYASVHHHNTRRVVAHAAEALGLEAVDIVANPDLDLRDVDTVVLASGIYFNALHKSLRAFMERAPLSGKRVALVYTCGLEYRDFAAPVARVLARMGANYLGCSHCRGYDTFGPLKALGGIAKGHPDAADVQRVTRELAVLLGTEKP